jgi:hypothetical protein
MPPRINIVLQEIIRSKGDFSKKGNHTHKKKSNRVNANNILATLETRVKQVFNDDHAMVKSKRVSKKGVKLW